MYGVVLMMALSGGGADLPAMNDAAGEHVARYGDHGQKQYRCGGRRRGCCGGCYGGGYGCYGGGYGCCGGGYGYGCSGGGYGYGTMPYAGSYYGYAPESGATYYGYSPYGGAPVYSGGMPADYGYGVRADQGYYGGQTPERLGAPLAGGQAPATILVNLPGDARLTIDGASTSSTQEMRTFISPPLQPGREYQYTLRAEVTRDGKKVERTREVTVRAGQQSQVTFDLPAQGGPPRD
jgi:uncharacterized protein (TIGR03000 family)